MLETTPEMGRPVEELPGVRELIIPFGGSGYVILYRYDMTADTVYILAIRHQKETGYE
jgi:plasmid stabilization system protein ParE